MIDAYSRVLVLLIELSRHIVHMLNSHEYIYFIALLVHVSCSVSGVDRGGQKPAAQNNPPKPSKK